MPALKLQGFQDSLEKLLIECQTKYPPSIYLDKIKKLKQKFKITNTVITKTDKSKVFHLGKQENYAEKRKKIYGKDKGI